VLNVTQDHLDRYPDGMSGYAAAKARIFGPHTAQVLNRDDDEFANAMRRTDARC
jgi:UDP-N-acetylmuramoylalanine--D-glutamate ligase